MADRNREEYNDRERRWRRRNEGEGIIDRIGDWFSGEDEPREQDRSRRDNWQRERGYRSRYGRDYDQNANRYSNRSSGREYDREGSRDADWERTRQWRQGSDREPGYERQYGRDRDTFGDRYGQNYGRDWDYGYGENSDYTSDYGRSYNRGNRRYRDYDRDYIGDWESRRNRDYYGSGEYEELNRRYGQGRRYGQNFGRDYNRGYQVRSAGMGTDFDSELDYESRDYDFGYESEGAFYQDLDEPISYSYYEVWMIPGEYTGMGPSSYHRTDERIFEDICERLTEHGRIDPSDVEVQVNNGEVTLTGTVRSREMKRLTEDTVDTISGVKDINNQIKVKHEDRERGWSRDRGQDWNRETDRSQVSYSEGSPTARGTITGESSTTEESSIPTNRRIGDSGEHASETMVTPGVEFKGTSSEGSGKNSQVISGMEVIGHDGKVVGRVKEVRGSDFLVDREMARDVFIPFDALQSVGAQAMLTITADEVDNQDWEKPEIF